MYLTTGELALIAGGFTLVGTALGGKITYVVTNRQVKSAEAEGTRQRKHDSDQRAIDRRHEIMMRDQERRAASYLPLMQLIGELSGIATSSRLI